MNYILVSSRAAQNGHQRVYFCGPTYIDHYAENNSVPLLDAQLRRELMAHLLWYLQPMIRYYYEVRQPPLVVLEFLKKHGYKVVGTDTMGDTCRWTLHKQPETTEQETQTDAATTDQSTQQTDAATSDQSTQQTDAATSDESTQQTDAATSDQSTHQTDAAI